MTTAAKTRRSEETTGPTEPMSLNDAVNTLALSKAVSDKIGKEARRQITPGAYSVDMTVNVKGSFNVGEDYDSVPTVKIPYKLLLAYLMQTNGAVRDAVIKIVSTDLEKLMTQGDKPEYKHSEDELDLFCKQYLQPILDSLPKMKSMGKVTTKLTTEIL